MSQFWKIESDGNQEHSFVLSDEDIDASKVFRKTIRHNSERYEIGLPWKKRCLLENNFYCASNHLRCLEKRLGNNPTLKEKYDQTLSTDLIKKYIKPVEMTEPEPANLWYSPHHPVQNPNKPRTVRRVANAASTYRGQHLLTGPDLLNSLLGILLRFREHPVEILADIESMFMQILSNEKINQHFAFSGRKTTF